MMSAKDWGRIMVSILIVSAMMFSGCGKKSEERISEEMTEKMLKETTGKDVDVNIQGKNIKIEGEGTKAEISETNVWPPDMFEGVPQFSAGRIDHVTKSQEGGTRSFNIFFADVSGDALKDYDAVLKKKGWQTQLVDMGKGMMISAQKDKLGLNLSFSNEDKRGTLAVFTAQ
jgi:hypothetical protein